MQDIIVIILVLSAVVYLIYRFIKSNKRKDDCGDGNCGCH